MILGFSFVKMSSSFQWVFLACELGQNMWVENLKQVNVNRKDIKEVNVNKWKGKSTTGKKRANLV